MNPFHHAESSARKYGGVAEDYQPIHDFFDESKAFMPDFRHRALRHHAEGIFLAEKIFGPTIINSDGRRVPTRFLGEQHVKEDLGRIPTVQDWFEALVPQSWMMKSGKLSSGAPSEAETEVDSEMQSESPEVCECEQPGYFCCGVPGILAHLKDGRAGSPLAVERCDLCQRYATDQEAYAKLSELGFV